MTNLEQFQRDGKFLMLALDHRGSFKKLISPTDPDHVEKGAAIALKHDIMQSVHDLMSGVLIDPDYGLPAKQGIEVPFLLPLEESGYSDEGGERLTRLVYSAAQLKDWGAGGAKVLIYFNPDLKSASQQLEAAQQALADAQSVGLPLFLEIRVYDLKSGDKVELVGDLLLRSLTMFLRAGIHPAVYKLEYPDNAQNCQKLTAMLKGIPWILLTKGASFDTFKFQLQEAMTNGAQGFLAGRAVWQEVGKLAGRERQDWLHKTVRPRFEQINQIALS